MREMSRLRFASRLFSPPSDLYGFAQHSAKCKSLKLMLNNGLIHHASGSGLFHLLPLGQRSMDKLLRIIAEEMDAIGAQKLTCTALGGRKLWEKTQRWDKMGSEMFTLTDRNQVQFCLQPTYEEAVTEIVANAGLQPVGRFPLLLYQLNEKYRDEQSPRLGLLRSRSFIMNDLYSFDLNENDAHKTYERVTNAYWQIFNRRLALRTYRVRATSGLFGGPFSHEFHLENPLGQDTIFVCSNCESGVNAEVLPEGMREQDSHTCEQCSTPMQKLRTIEVGHTFALGTKYSDAFGAAHDNRSLYMCCFGIGVSRLLAAAVDVLSPDDTQLRLPGAIAPFQLVIVPPKSGSHQDIATPFVLDVADALSHLPQLALDCDILVDDRINLTIGRRVTDAVKLGVPWIVIGGKTTAESMMQLAPAGELAPTLLEVKRTVPGRRDARSYGTLTHADLASTLIRQLGEKAPIETDGPPPAPLIR